MKKTEWVVFYVAEKNNLAVCNDFHIIAYVSVDEYTDILRHAAEYDDVEVVFEASALHAIAKKGF